MLQCWNEHCKIVLLSIQHLKTGILPLFFQAKWFMQVHCLLQGTPGLARQGRLPALLLSLKTGFPVRQSACFIPPGKRQPGLYFSTLGASRKGEAPSVSAVMEAKPKEKKCDHFRGTKSLHFCCYILGTKIAGTGPSCRPQHV